jgi:hypothetical protein
MEIASDVASRKGSPERIAPPCFDLTYKTTLQKTLTCQPADGRTPALPIKILEEQEGWNESRKLNRFIDERPKPLRFTEGHQEGNCIHEQSQAVWAGELPEPE